MFTTIILRDTFVLAYQTFIQKYEYNEILKIELIT